MTCPRLPHARLLAAMIALLAPLAAGAADAAAEPPPLPDGQPDLRGFWTAEVDGTYSLTNPRRGGGNVPPKWYLAQHGGSAASARPSRIVDPPDGQVPYRPAARAHQQLILADVDHPTSHVTIDPQARCFPDGVTRTLFWSEFEVQQYPGVVVFLFDGNHTFRVIPVDGRPHIPAAVKLWMSDSRGHWEGRTLVVDVTNSNAKHRLSNEGDWSSDGVHIVQRFTFVDAGTIRYSETLDDPAVYTRPWTMAATFHRTHAKEPGWEQWENSCHEGERSAESLLSSAPASAPAAH